MIKVGFIFSGSKKWIAGINYLKNLLYALSLLDRNKIGIVLFVGKKTSKDLINDIPNHIEIVFSSFFDRTGICWLIRRVIRKLFNKDYLLLYFLKKNNIDILSHPPASKYKMSFKTINWIADFQHIRLPEMFPNETIIKRNDYFKNMIESSNLIILSSHDALNDFKKFSPKDEYKARVLQFVSMINEEIYNDDIIDSIKKEFSINSNFFYMPNQFWIHKNHLIVFEAVKILKDKGLNILLICTGSTNEPRQKNYFESINKYIRNNQLENNIKIIGLIEYRKVLTLMRHSISVINPSLFEGWSTSVEEAKSLGKNLILSNIKVHQEQNPPNAIYFDKKDAHELALILERKFNERNSGPDFDLEAKARKNLNNRILKYGQKYYSYVLELMNNETKI